MSPRPLLPAWLWCALLLVLVCVRPAEAQPRLLSQTGFGSAAAQGFTPVYPLWSDGTAKRRWIALPAGTTIDARDPDAWVFPRGTRLWKEFAYGSKVETRYLERLANGQWRFATYVWRADGSDAELAPAHGIGALPVADAPGGRYAIPSQDDCRNCHAGARSTVLGFSALQLGDALPALMARGLIRNAPAAWRQAGPRIEGDTEAERAARGYLHGNCGHCHHPQGVPVPLVLAQSVAGATAAPTPEQRALALRRMQSRNPYTQMPPLGTQLPDPTGLALMQAWLAQAPADAADGLAQRIALHLRHNPTQPQEPTP